MAMQIGARIGAILSATEEVVYLLGYGVYEGAHEPPFGAFGVSKDEHDALVAKMKAAGELPADYVWTNPRLRLDDGRVVWGAQCWWGPEDMVRERIGKRAIVPADVPS